MKIYLDTVGCRLNQAEIEIMARQFRAAGHEIVANPEEADLAVVNTCTVTSAAASDSRGKIRAAARSGVSDIAVTGCWVTLDPEAASQLPAVKHIVPNQLKDQLVPKVLDRPLETFDLEPIEREPIPGSRLRTRAFIKVQDGCDNRCTFCVTTVARGAGVSRPTEQILADIHAAHSSQEIVLTGVHLGSWGKDLGSQIHLKHLVQEILDQTDVPRLRLSSLEPWDLDEDFFQLWKNSRLCRHLHLPLQSGSAATLKRMARKTTPEEFSNLVKFARSAIPGVAITTDVITGFPGESEAEFQESLAFVREMNFSGGHVFTYSARPGTAAAKMPNQVPVPVRKECNAQMRAVFSASSQAYQTRFIGQILPVLWENATAVDTNNWKLSGLTGNYLRVNAYAPRRLWNQITPVKLASLTQEGLSGQIQFL
jgi:threonylcarbamoyladenosine tRNA methylthiotransferase MtaB